MVSCATSSVENDEAGIKRLKESIKSNRSEVNTAKASLDKLLDLYLTDKLTKDKYLSKEKELNQKIKVFEKQLQENELKLELIGKEELTYENIHRYLEVVGNFSKDLTPLELANLVGSLFPKGTLYENKLVMHSSMKGIPFDVEIPIGEDMYKNRYKKNSK